MTSIKKGLILILLITLVISGCSNGKAPDNDDSKDSLEYDSIISPSIDLNEQYYRGVLPYKSSPINGLLNNIPGRLDSKYLEFGLLELAKNVFDPTKYIFQEGQLLKIEDVEALYDTTMYPQFENFIFAINEHDYLNEDGQLEGVVIGLSVSKTYFEKDANGEYVKDVFGQRKVNDYTEEELSNLTQQLINEIILKVRRYSDAPILFGAMAAQETDYKIPGAFFLSGTVNRGNNEIDDLTEIDEQFIFLPTDISYQGIAGDMARMFTHFKDTMEDYLPGFAGITAFARTRDDDISEVTIKIYAELDSTVETIQYTQFAISMIDKYFPEKIQINLYINSIDEPKAIYVRKADGNDFIHIYRD